MLIQWRGQFGKALNCGNSIANVAIAIYGRVISSLMYTHELYTHVHIQKATDVKSKVMKKVTW